MELNRVMSAMCQKRTYAVQQNALFDHFVGAQGERLPKREIEHYPPTFGIGLGPRIPSRIARFSARSASFIVVVQQLEQRCTHDRSFSENSREKHETPPPVSFAASLLSQNAMSSISML
jgi:hypothetical protein